MWKNMTAEVYLTSTTLSWSRDATRYDGVYPDVVTVHVPYDCKESLDVVIWYDCEGERIVMTKKMPRQFVISQDEISKLFDEVHDSGEFEFL